MRVLHLIDEPPDGAADAAIDACRLLQASGDGSEHVVVLIGPSSLARSAVERGLAPAARVSPPLGSARLAARPLARLARRSARFDVVQCWSPATAGLARAALGSAVPRRAVLLAPPPLDEHRRRRAARACAGAIAAACGAPARQEWIDAGIDASRITLVAPPVTPREPDVTERGAIRRRLGLSPVELAVLLVGGAPHADAVRFVFLIGLLGVSGVRVTGVVPRDAAQFDRAARFALGGRDLNRVILSDHAASRLVPGMDAAVFDGGGYGPTTARPPRPAAGTLAIATAHALGVPVVAPAWADDHRLVPRDAARELLALNHAAPELARVVAALAGDRARLASLGRHVREHLAAQRPDLMFASAIAALWTRAAASTAPAPTTSRPRPEVASP